MTTFDVIVVGAGHAGVEAAVAAARMGCHVGLCTLSLETMAHMPCNPAVGGTAKGHLVREIDALGGVMGKAIDATGIQFKLLNRSRGPAVWSPRAQADKALYSSWVAETVGREPNIETIVKRAGGVLVENGHVVGLSTEDGEVLKAKAVVITTGTFLNGLIHIGSDQRPAGRHGEPPSRALAESIRAQGFSMGRLKTGTPPRLDRKSIDFQSCVEDGRFAEELGDDVPTAFSFETSQTLRNRARCWLLHTNDRVSDLVRSSIEKSPLYNGQIKGIGPRYCPSLEDKIMRFPQRERHQIYLEPEGLSVDEIYVNGFSTSLPREIQEALVHSLPGLENAVMMRPGYAVEYDFVQPTELKASLETHRLPGLFFAGQINGTSGYEEAAAQGLMAGINAARQVLRQPAFVIGRDEGYIGVLVDDLVTRGCLEPYRMFTSRAEHRLLLRIDNADLRLTPTGRALGLIGDERWQRFEARRGRYDRNMVMLETSYVRNQTGDRVTAAQLLKQPDVRIKSLVDAREVTFETEPASAELDVVSVETSVKYAGYLRQANAQAERSRKNERRRIPTEFPFARVPGLSTEAIHRLTQVRPETLGQASRIPGITPASIAVLDVFLGRLTADSFDFNPLSSREFQDRLSRRARRAGVSLSPELGAKLEVYYKLLTAWNEKMNLTGLQLAEQGPAAIDCILVEPLVAARHASPVQRMIDIGTGGGSPAIPLALALSASRVLLVEAKTRKSVFLREALRALEMTEAEVATSRFEELLAKPDLHEAHELLTLRAVRVESAVLMNLQAFVRPGGELFLFRAASGAGSPGSLMPPLSWKATFPLLESQGSRLVVLVKRSEPRSARRFT